MQRIKLATCADSDQPKSQHSLFRSSLYAYKHKRSSSQFTLKALNRLGGFADQTGQSFIAGIVYFPFGELSCVTPEKKCIGDNSGKGFISR